MSKQATYDEGHIVKGRSLIPSGEEVGDRNLNTGLAIKRVLDIFMSGIALVFLTIPLLIIAMAIKHDSNGPVLFRQERIGKDGKPFMIFKFRTMRQGAETVTFGIYIDSGNPSITRLGHFLRRWGLDELPQLLNVFRGDMSLVGPRPTLSYQVEKYDETQMLRLRVKPGLTGWAQVNGRNKLNWPKRIELDVWYAENWSLLMDAKILALTPVALLRRDFAYADGVAEDEFARPM